MSDIITKTCTKCGETFPATTEYFNRDLKGRHGLSSQCKICRCGKQKSWRDVNKDKIRERDKRYREANPEKTRERQNRWVKTNPEKDRLNKQHFHNTHPNKHSEYARNYKLAHPEKYAQIQKKYTESHPEVSKRRTANRRARQYNAPGTHTAADIRRQLAAQTDKRGVLHCWWCGKAIKGTYHVDHWTPLDKNGSNDAGNIRIMHAKCNLRKSAKLPGELGRLL